MKGIDMRSLFADAMMFPDWKEWVPSVDPDEEMATRLVTFSHMVGDPIKRFGRVSVARGYYRTQLP